MALSDRDIEHLFERLRSGVVPERGLERFGIEPELGLRHRPTDAQRQPDGSIVTGELAKETAEWALVVQQPRFLQRRSRHVDAQVQIETAAEPGGAVYVRLQLARRKPPGVEEEATVFDSERAAQVLERVTDAIL